MTESTVSKLRKKVARKAQREWGHMVKERTVTWDAAVVCPCCDATVSIFPPTRLLGYIVMRAEDTECVIEAWLCPHCAKHFYTENIVSGLAPEWSSEQLTLF